MGHSDFEQGAGAGSVSLGQVQAGRLHRTASKPAEKRYARSSLENPWAVAKRGQGTRYREEYASLSAQTCKRRGGAQDVQQHYLSVEGFE